MAEKSWPHWNQSTKLITLLILQYPWLKSRGPIETPLRNARFCYQSVVSMAEKSWPHWNFVFGFINYVGFFSIHGWKVVAPLKLTQSGTDGFRKSLSIHGWKVVAPLKLFHHNVSLLFRFVYPWLKSRGPIETRDDVGTNYIKVQIRYPWLKSRGPIETRRRVSGTEQQKTYPWLKSRGPIETPSTRSWTHTAPLKYPWLKSRGPIKNIHLRNGS